MIKKHSDQKSRGRLWAKVLLFCLVFLAVLYGTFVLGYTSAKKGVELNIGSTPTEIINSEKGKPNSVNFVTFWEAWSVVKDNFSGEMDAKKMVYGAISGMLRALGDPYTVFLRPDENEQFLDDISGEFEGIGVEIELVEGLPTVIAPLSDTPAEKAGIKAKDIILEVDGINTEEIGFDETINRIRGKKGTKVELKIYREGEEELLTIKVKRDTIKVASVNFEIKTGNEKHIGYIKIRQFGNETLTEFEAVVKQIKSEKIDGIILDLRNNPGGYLDTSVDIVSYFIDGGVIVSEVEKNDKKKEFTTTKEASLKNYILVVLVNEGSASASEIVAGAVKDRKRGKIVGKVTFGKGSVQVLQELSDSSAVKITVAKWLTPNGDHIDNVGIVPDIEIEDNQETEADEVFERAIKLFDI